MSTGPLEGIRVIEAGQLLAGPFCGQLLADFGAEVIKLEPPGVGDPMRQWGREKADGEPLWWPVVARGKRSVTLDLRQPAGQGLARRLLAEADVFVENFRPGTLERWGLGPDELHSINSDLIIVRVTGYGQNGPYSNLPGYGSIGEAMGGLRYICGDPTTPPSRVGISIGDTLAAMYSCIGVLVALHARGTTGRGQVVDTALYEAVLGVMESLIPEYVLAGYTRERSGSILPNVAPSNVYPTSDGEMILIAANADSVFARLASAMGRDELATDECYSTHIARGQRQVELDEMISEWTKGLTAAELQTVLNEYAVPAGKIYKAKDMLADPHFAAREAIVNIPHKRLGEFPMQGVVPKLTETPGSIRWVGPDLGEDTADVLGSVLGLSSDEISSLRTAKVI